MSVESVLRCGLLKQHRQLSYKELAFHLMDSASFQALDIRQFALLKTLLTTDYDDNFLDSCITRDTIFGMSNVNIRELRNHGGEVINRVLAGECLTVTRAGRPVAELRPLPWPGIDAATLLGRWRNLPHVDPDRFRRDIDEVIDASL